MKIIVIGSGMSGLTAAAYLAQAGHAVTVYEQNSEIGGVTATLRKNGFGWDNGPLNIQDIGPGEPGGVALQELGIADQIRLTRADRGVSFDAFKLRKSETYGGPYWRRDLLKQIFPQEAAAIDRYYQFYDVMLSLMALGRKGENAKGLAGLAVKLRMALLFSRVSKMKDWTAEQLLADFFQSPALRAVYSGMLADFVTKPSEFQGLGIPFINIETAYDTRIPLDTLPAGAQPSYHYVLGGIGELAAAFAGAVQRFGGRLVTGAAVEKILIENGRACGVRLADGSEEKADLVVASGGAKETFYNLVGRETLPTEFTRKLDEIPLMESVVMVHLGVDMDPHAGQPESLVYYYHSHDVEGAVERARRGDYHEGRDGFLIYIPTYHTPGMAPQGQHAVTIYTIAPDRLREGEWKDCREDAADKLIAEAEAVIPGLSSHIVEKMILTPDDFRALTHLQHHAFGGVAPVMGKAGMPFKSPVEGLWFIGAQSESGGGVGNVIAGTRKAARRILGLQK